MVLVDLARPDRPVREGEGGESLQGNARSAFVVYLGPEYAGREAHSCISSNSSTLKYQSLEGSFDYFPPLRPRLQLQGRGLIPLADRSSDDTTQLQRKTTHGRFGRADSPCG